MKRRSFLATIASLFSIPFIGKAKAKTRTATLELTGSGLVYPDRWTIAQILYMGKRPKDHEYHTYTSFTAEYNWDNFVKIWNNLPSKIEPRICVDYAKLAEHPDPPIITLKNGCTIMPGDTITFAVCDHHMEVHRKTDIQVTT